MAKVLEPLHTHFEYERAMVVSKMLKNKAYMIGLSPNDRKEQKELTARIYKYRKDCLSKMRIPQ